MTLRLYNTLTRTKEEFKPLDPRNVRMYVCGPTVYDYAHIGNARPVIVFDVLFRLLRHLYGAEHVTYVRNITDIDDKINARAREEGTTIRELTERTYKQFREDISALGVLEPTFEPRATETIPEMITLIERLIGRGHAYVAEGHVLFDVPSMKDYGKLAHRSLDEMIAGARVDVAPYKRDPMDFVLWKPSDADTPGWESPWGRGRPGWHIECSAMADRWLWQEPKLKGLLSEAGLRHPHVFDIHGGGIDLVFPHHENEIAQSRCAHGTSVMANYWMHNGFLQIEGRKMAKSEGNFVTINELLTGWRGFAWPGQVLRLAMLSTHYRQPIDFSQHALGQAVGALAEFVHFSDTSEEEVIPPSDRFLAAMFDDLNTPEAIAELHRLAKEARTFSLMKALTPGEPIPLMVNDEVTPHAQLAAGLRFLGIDPDAYNKGWMQDQLQNEIDSKTRTNVEALIARRNEARRTKDWAESDRIRDELAEMGVVLKDNKDGTTTWEVKR